MKILLVVLGVLLLAGLMFGGKFVSVRNDLASQNEAISAAWAQVDVALQRRADLIPNLVSTVKGFAVHEQQVIDSVTAARAALGGARTPQATPARHPTMWVACAPGRRRNRVVQTRAAWARPRDKSRSRPQRCWRGPTARPRRKDRRRTQAPSRAAMPSERRCGRRNSDRR